MCPCQRVPRLCWRCEVRRIFGSLFTIHTFSALKSPFYLYVVIATVFSLFIYDLFLTYRNGYFPIKAGELSIMEKGITLHEAEDLTSWLDGSEPIVNLSEPGLSHCTAGLVVSCTHRLLGEWNECPPSIIHSAELTLE